MLTRWPIKKKLALGGALLMFAVSMLAVAGFHNAYSFRGLVRSISRRATEVPIAVRLAAVVSGLQPSIPGSQVDDAYQFDSFRGLQFSQHLEQCTKALESYREVLEANKSAASAYIGDFQLEMETVHELEARIAQINELRTGPGEHWPADEVTHELLVDAVAQMNQFAEPLPRYLQDRMLDLQGEVRGYYRMWIVVTWITSIVSAIVMLVLIHLFYLWIFRPLRQLINGSRQIAAAGDFEYRIRLASGDEMEELANALNEMTDRFQQIRDDLDRQVKQRTREVIRGEQLASVGFLAAGVAHEINNPLASIALCAESLEERVADLLRFDQLASGATSPDVTSDSPTELRDDEMTGHEPPPIRIPSPTEREADAEVVRDYLHMIQTEAFRCKGITEKLLDFSRLGNVQRQSTNLRELVTDVIEMVQHVGEYKNKEIRFDPSLDTWVHVNPQELKQVVLNLITNGLDSLTQTGRVVVSLLHQENEAVLRVRDNGCGMTEEVRSHLFEPFFTRRRDGKGTGLGMSISYRIINEHGGQIEVASDGVDRGSTITVRLPKSAPQTEIPHDRAA